MYLLPTHPEFGVTLRPPPSLCNPTACGLDVPLSAYRHFCGGGQAIHVAEGFGGKVQTHVDGICRHHCYFSQREKPSAASGGAFHFECNGSVTHGTTFSFRAQCCANKTNGNFVTARKERRIWPFRATHLILVCRPPSIFNEKMGINRTKSVPQVPDPQ